ncbi:MAG: hypothetical protein M3Y22_13055 [Pseudomonadota bacterium]|nr:hypothetical protein [Pseudomonadota bacterium]
MFAAVSLAFHALANGHGVAAALLLGSIAALAVVLIGEWTFAHSRWPALKMLVAAVFAGPAAFAAYYAFRGLAASVMPDNLGVTSTAPIAAIFTGWLALARVAEKGQRRFAEAAQYS